jgi:hypothetical protein
MGAPLFSQFDMGRARLAHEPKAGGVTARWEHLADVLRELVRYFLFIRCSLRGLLCDAYTLLRIIF